MPTKSPIYLKTGGKSAAGNKDGPRLREILSSDMISPPLGDFRHTAHVGRGGTEDMFGDTSFLEKDTTWSATVKDVRQDRPTSINQKANENGKRSGNSQPTARSRTLDRCKKDKSRHPASGDGDTDCSTSPMQSAFSLPQLNASGATTSEESMEATSQAPESSNICEKRLNSQSMEDVNLTNPQDVATPANACEGPPKPRRILSTSAGKNGKTEIDGNSDHNMAESSLMKPKLSTRSEESPAEDEDWGLDLDLGPSLMDEVMGALKKC